MSAPYTPAAPPTFPPASTAPSQPPPTEAVAQAPPQSYYRAPPPAQPFPNAVPPFSSTGLTQPHAPPPVSPQSFTQAPPFSQPRFSTAQVPPGPTQSYGGPLPSTQPSFPRSRFPSPIPPRSLRSTAHLESISASRGHASFPTLTLPLRSPSNLYWISTSSWCSTKASPCWNAGPSYGVTRASMASMPLWHHKGLQWHRLIIYPLHNLACHLVLSTLPVRASTTAGMQGYPAQQNGEHQHCYR